MPTFLAYAVSLELARAVREPAAALATRNASLADQLLRACISVGLNVSEGNRRAGRDRTHLFRVALGSASEVQAYLELAEALGLLSAAAIAGALAPADRVQRLLRGLTRAAAPSPVTR